MFNNGLQAKVEKPSMQLIKPAGLPSTNAMAGMTCGALGHFFHQIGLGEGGQRLSRRPYRLWRIR